MRRARRPGHCARGSGGPHLRHVRGRGAGRCNSGPPRDRSGPVRCELDPAVATADEPPQQERAGLGPPWAENGVVTSGSLDGFEGLLADDGRDGDLGPLLSRPAGLADPPDGGVVARASAVPEQPPHVRLVVQQAPDRGQRPHWPASGEGTPSAARALARLRTPAPPKKSAKIRRTIAASWSCTTTWAGPSGPVGRVGSRRAPFLRAPRQLLTGTFPPPFPLGELRLFVLGYNPLHLDQQPRLGVAVNGRGVGEIDDDAEPGQFVGTSIW